MKNIFALYGRGNSGKSETIKLVFKLISSKYPQAIINQIINGADIKVIMTGVNGLTIGIESQGDPNTRLQQSLIDFEKAGCDIIFCPSRTRGMTVNWITSHSKKYKIDWTEKTLSSSKSNQHNINLSDANILLSKSGL